MLKTDREKTKQWKLRSQEKARLRAKEKGRYASKKHLNAERELSKIKAEMIAEDALCRRCRVNLGTDPHHIRGRTGSFMTDRRYITLLCRTCHSYIETHWDAAVEEGWMQSKHRNRDLD